MVRHASARVDATATRPQDQEQYKEGHTMYMCPLDVCETCMLIIANGSTDGAYSEADEERSDEAMRDRGPFTLGDVAENLEFSLRECDICGALPGERFRVYEWDS